MKQGMTNGSVPIVQFNGRRNKMLLCPRCDEIMVESDNENYECPHCALTLNRPLHRNEPIRFTERIENLEQSARMVC